MYTISGAKRLLPLVILLSGPILVAFTLMPLPSAQNGVTLPIEVIGPDGHTKSVTANVSDASGVVSLYLKAYSIGYPKHYINDRGYTVSKASIRLNGGSWVDIDNKVAECKYPEKKLNCVTGPMHTIRFEIPISELGNLADGSNTIDFRFNYADADDRYADAPGDPSTGYRILDLELRNAGDTDQIDGTTFEWDDPSSWSPPAGHDNAQSISDGKDLWTQRDLLVDYWNGPEITAACADCHAKDGRDLQYFAFSNESIIARSKFHGLTETQGKKIAAYIRSVELKDPDSGQSYDPPGRPWHPPYQPGPTAVATRSAEASRTTGSSFSETDSQYWAAGAGIDWMLDHDRDILPHLFPGEVSQDDIDLDSTNVNPRQLPVSFQYPDWNEWLPEIHPLDAYGSTFRDGYEGWNPWGIYNGELTDSYSTFYDCVESNSINNCLYHAQDALRQITKNTERFKEKHPPLASGVEYEKWDAEYGVRNWMAVKEWELIHTYDLMDDGQEIFNSDASPLMWPSNNDDVFSHASHVTNDNELKGSHSETLHNLYFDTAWYDLQVIINNGRGLGTGQNIVDWKYQHPHLHQQSSQAEWPQYLRYVRSFLVLMNNANIDRPMFNGDKFPEQWKLRHVQLPWIGQEQGRLGGLYGDNGLDDYRSGLTKEVETEVARAWYEGAVVGNDWTNYCRQDDDKNCIETQSFDPEILSWWGPANAGDYASRLMTYVDDAEEKGRLKASMADSLRNWGASLWPNATDPTWAELFPVTQSISLNTGWNFVSSRADLSGISIDQVFSDVDGLAAVKDANGQAYLPQLNVNQIGTWSTSDGYKVHVENAQEATVTGDPVDRERPIELKEGWNLIPYYPHVPMDVDTAFSSIEDSVEVVRDEDGNEYVPSQKTNEIDDLVPGDAYAIYVTSDVTFVYPSLK